MPRRPAWVEGLGRRLLGLLTLLGGDSRHERRKICSRSSIRGTWSAGNDKAGGGFSARRPTPQAGEMRCALMST